MATLASLNTIQSLYVAYYGRPADPAGLEFWATLLDQSQGELSSIINAFGTSSEYTNRFGNNTPAQAVNNLYQQLFGRDAEPEGLEFHVNLIISGQKTLAEIALQISIGAQGGDRTVFEGRTTVANAFTRELDTPEEILAYSSDRGVLIGQNYLKLVTEQNPASVVLRDAAPVVKTLLPETEPETPPGGGGGETPPPAPTFTATLDENGIVTFSGTVTGAITLTSDHGVLTFTRDGLNSALPGEQNVNQIELGSATLNVPAYFLNGVTVNGTGALSLTDLEFFDDIDLSQLDSHLTVTVAVTGDLDISENANLGTVDIYQVSNGAQLTLTLEQYTQVTIQGQGTLFFSDTFSALLDAQNGGNLLDAATSLVITDAVSIFDLGLLAGRTDTPFTYSTVRDISTNLITDANSNGGAGTYVTEGIDVIVTDKIDIQGLTDVYSAVGENSTVIANDLEDTVAHLINGGVVNSYVTAGSNVTVDDVATVAEIKLIDDANGDGSLTYSLEDSFGNILDQDNADLVAGAENITLLDYNLGERTVADIQALMALENLKDADGNAIELDDLVYSLVDSSAALSSSVELVAEIVTGATSVEANDEAYVYQARIIFERDSGATYSITDSVSSLLSTADNTRDAVNNAVNVTANNTANASQAQQLFDLTNSGDTIYNVADSYVNLTNVSYTTGINGATNLTNYTNLYDIVQAQTLVDFNNSGITSIGYLRDTVADINTFVGANERSDMLSYNFYVRDTSANILTAIGIPATAFITGNPALGFEGDALVANIEVTDTFNIDGAETFWTTVDPIFKENSTTTASKTYYVVRDDINDYTNEVTARFSIIDADQRIIDGSAEDIHQAQRGTLTDNRDIFNLLSGSDYMVVTGSAGNQTIVGGPGSDTINVGDDNDTVYGGTGNDTIRGGAGYDRLYGEDGRDTIFADQTGANTEVDWIYRGSETIVGGRGGDNMYGGANADIFIYEGSTRAELIAESGTTSSARDYITNFYLGDKIQFQNADSVQFFSSGSANAYSVDAGTLGLSIRYEKNASVLNWQGDNLVEASRIFIDVADENGQFDDIADMHIILVGSNIDINWDGSYLTFGG